MWLSTRYRRVRNRRGFCSFFNSVNRNSSGGMSMIRRILAASVLTVCTSVAFAAQPVTFVLRNGDRVSGELTYKGGTVYTLNGRDYPSNDIAMIAFAPGDPTAAELQQIPTVDNNPSEHE